MTREDITNKLKGRNMEWMPVNDTIPAVVMIPLVPRGDYYDVVLEVRAANITQGGEVCLPGGVVEEGETSLDAGIRELCEELKVDASQIDVVCPMIATGGPQGRMIESYLVFLDDYQGTYNSDEVQEILQMPIRFFYAAEPIVGDIDLIAQVRDNFPVHLMANEQGPWFQPVKRSYDFYEAKGHVIWGLTANILKKAADIIYGDEHPTREYD